MAYPLQLEGEGRWGEGLHYQLLVEGWEGLGH